MTNSRINSYISKFGAKNFVFPCILPLNILITKINKKRTNILETDTVVDSEEHDASPTFPSNELEMRDMNQRSIAPSITCDNPPTYDSLHILHM